LNAKVDSKRSRKKLRVAIMSVADSSRMQVRPSCSPFGLGLILASDACLHIAPGRSEGKREISEIYNPRELKKLSKQFSSLRRSGADRAFHKDLNERGLPISERACYGGNAFGDPPPAKCRVQKTPSKTSITLVGKLGPREVAELGASAVRPRLLE